MSRPNKTKPEGPPSDPRPSSTARLFTPRKAKTAPMVTHERIAEDLQAFRKAGGKIEVLGTTRSLKKIDPDDETSPPPRPANAAPSKSRR